MVSGFLWWFKVLDKCLPPWGSGLTPTVSPRFHRPRSTEHKTPRLKVKATLNSQEHLEKSHIYEEKSEKEKENKIQTGVKKEECNLANKFCK